MGLITRGLIALLPGFRGQLNIDPGSDDCSGNTRRCVSLRENIRRSCNGLISLIEQLRFSSTFAGQCTDVFIQELLPVRALMVNVSTLDKIKKCKDRQYYASHFEAFFEACQHVVAQ